MLRSQSGKGCESPYASGKSKQAWDLWEAIIRTLHRQGKTKKDILDWLGQVSYDPPSMHELMAQMRMWNLGVNPRTTSASEMIVI